MSVLYIIFLFHAKLFYILFFQYKRIILFFLISSYNIVWNFEELCKRERKRKIVARK